MMGKFLHPQGAVQPSPIQACFSSPSWWSMHPITCQYLYINLRDCMAAETVCGGQGSLIGNEGGVRGEQWHIEDKDIRRRNAGIGGEMRGKWGNGGRMKDGRVKHGWGRENGTKDVFFSLTILIHGFSQISKALSICPNEPWSQQHL